jgi:DNA-binding response OmpR family regulator
VTEARKRILLVEDEFLIALDTMDVLTQAGYEVVGPATSLERAHGLIECEVFDAAVLDVNLGGTYVWPVAERLADRGVPVVLLTGFGNGLQVPAKLQASPRLGKPLRENELLEAISACTKL